MPLMSQHFFRLTTRIRVSHLGTAVIVSIIVVALKLIFQYFSLELFKVDALLTAIISGIIFILGLLLNSTLRDYKEAEKIPVDIAAALESIYGECEIVLINSKMNPIALEAAKQLIKIEQKLTAWFHQMHLPKTCSQSLLNSTITWQNLKELLRLPSSYA